MKVIVLKRNILWPEKVRLTCSALCSLNTWNKTELMNERVCFSESGKACCFRSTLDYQRCEILRTGANLNKPLSARFDFVTATSVKMKMDVLWDVALCKTVPQIVTDGSEDSLPPASGWYVLMGAASFSNVGWYLRVQTVQHPTRQPSCSVSFFGRTYTRVEQ